MDSSARYRRRGMPGSCIGTHSDGLIRPHSPPAPLSALHTTSAATALLIRPSIEKETGHRRPSSTPKGWPSMSAIGNKRKIKYHAPETFSLTSSRCGSEASIPRVSAASKAMGICGAARRISSRRGQGLRLVGCNAASCCNCPTCQYSLEVECCTWTTPV